MGKILHRALQSKDRIALLLIVHISFLLDIFIYISNVIPFLVFPPKTAYPSSPFTNPPTPSSLSWYSPVLGCLAFIAHRSFAPFDVQQSHPLLHMQLEPWVPPCVLFGWVLCPWDLWDTIGSCCSSYVATIPFNSLRTFLKSWTGDTVHTPMDGCEHTLLYLSCTGRASQETVLLGPCQHVLVFGIHNSVWVW